MLPPSVVGENVLGYLHLKDLVELDNSVMNRHSRAEFLDILSYCPPVSIENSIRPDKADLKWFKVRNCRISKMKLSLLQSDVFEVDTSQVQDVELDISRVVTDSDIDNLISRGMILKIKILTINHHENQDSIVMNRLLTALANLKELSISNYSDSWMAWLEAIYINMASLDSLTLYGNYSSVLSRNIAFDRLKALKLYFYRVNDENEYKMWLTHLWKQMPTLVDFHLSSPYSFSTNMDDCIVAIAQSCVKLRNILLRRCNITDAAVIAIAQHCPELRKLNISKLTTPLTHLSLLALSEHKLIEELGIPMIPIPTSDIAVCCERALSCISQLDWSNAEHFEGTQYSWEYMKSLRNFSMTGQVPEESALSGLSAVARHCSQLQSVDVPVLTDAVLQQLIALSSSMPALRSVQLSAAAALTDAMLIALSVHCPQLTSISLIDSPLLTDTGLIALSQHCPGLTSITLGNCPQCTDVGLIALSEQCKRLESIELHHIPQLTDKTILTLSQNNHRCLRLLLLPQCCLVTEAAVVELVQCCRALDFLQVPRTGLSEITRQKLQSYRQNHYTGCEKIYIFYI